MPWRRISTCVSHHDGGPVVHPGVHTVVHAGPHPVVHPFGQVALSNGRSGIVMVYHNNQWNTVCDDYFGYEEAQVICRQLFGTSPRHSSGWNSAHYNVNSWTTPAHLNRGSSNHNIIFDSLACSGSEIGLSQCGHGGYYQHDCSHSEDAWVVCN